MVASPSSGSAPDDKQAGRTQPMTRLLKVRVRLNADAAALVARWRTQPNERNRLTGLVARLGRDDPSHNHILLLSNMDIRTPDAGPASPFAGPLRAPGIARPRDKNDLEQGYHFSRGADSRAGEAALARRPWELGTSYRVKGGAERFRRTGKIAVRHESPNHRSRCYRHRAAETSAHSPAAAGGGARPQG